MANDVIVNTLKQLVQICKDCEYDFSLYARYTGSKELREHYMARSIRCRRTAHELRMRVTGLGGKAELRGTASGAIRRVLFALKATLRGRKNQPSWWKQCSQTELFLLTQYRRVLKAEVLPPHLQILIARQFHAWQHIHSQIRFLRVMAKAA